MSTGLVSVVVDQVANCRNPGDWNGYKLLRIPGEAHWFVLECIEHKALQVLSTIWTVHLCLQVSTCTFDFWCKTHSSVWIDAAWKGISQPV